MKPINLTPRLVALIFAGALLVIGTINVSAALYIGTALIKSP